MIDPPRIYEILFPLAAKTFQVAFIIIARLRSFLLVPLRLRGLFAEVLDS